MVLVQLHLILVQTGHQHSLHDQLPDMQAIIAEVGRILKPGGRLFSMILNEASTAKDTARRLANNDYTDFSGRLQGAGVLHFTNAAEVEKLFSAFVIDDIELILRKSQYPPSANKNVNAWTVVACRK